MRGALHVGPRSVPRACFLVRNLALQASGLTIVSCMSASQAVAARRPKRVQEILDYVYTKDNSFKVTSIPMEYERVPSTPLPPVVAGLEPTDVAPGNAGESDMARVIAALLYLAVGGLDQAHNLVTPLCWGSATAYGGAPVRNSPAASDAAYVHALVHRQEGSCDGEFGSGWSNSNYWYRAAGDHPIWGPLRAKAAQLAAGDPSLQRHVANHGATWQPTRFVELCRQAAESGDAAAQRFCGEVMKAEWQLLLDHCYARL